MLIGYVILSVLNMDVQDFGLEVSWIQLHCRLRCVVSCIDSYKGLKDLWDKTEKHLHKIITTLNAVVVFICNSPHVSSTCFSHKWMENAEMYRPVVLSCLSGCSGKQNWHVAFWCVYGLMRQYVLHRQRLRERGLVTQKVPNVALVLYLCLAMRTVRGWGVETKFFRAAVHSKPCLTATFTYSRPRFPSSPVAVDG